jgi:hypothetical protein
MDHSAQNTFYHQHANEYLRLHCIQNLKNRSVIEIFKLDIPLPKIETILYNCLNRFTVCNVSSICKRPIHPCLNSQNDSHSSIPLIFIDFVIHIIDLILIKCYWQLFIELMISIKTGSFSINSLELSFCLKQNQTSNNPC